MTSIRPPSTVLVTGANGFIASHVVSQLLEAGYKVIGSVRSQAKAAQLLAAHSNGNLSAAIIEDITSVSSILNGLETVSKPQEPISGILHLAAPFSYSVQDYERDLLLPAVEGSRAILQMAQIYGVQRVVHTNSFACIYDANAGPSPEQVYTAADWSPLTFEDGVTAPNAPTAYRAAKTVAEREAFSFMEQNAGLSFDLISLCPAMVFGPFLESALPDGPSLINQSNKTIWDVVSCGEKSEVPSTKGPVWVDVRDVAKAHVIALSTPELGGARLLLAEGVYCNQEIADGARGLFPEHRSRIPIGKPGTREADTHFKVHSSHEAKRLGLTWRKLEDTLQDLIPQLYAIEVDAGTIKR
jgi:nucleoside-diphosphate-sugar epimerase